MDVPNIVYFILVGIVAGWLAVRIMRGGSFGLVGNMVIGVIGALVGPYLFELLKINLGVGGFPGQLIMATVGAIVFIILLAIVLRLARK